MTAGPGLWRQVTCASAPLLAQCRVEEAVVPLGCCRLQETMWDSAYGQLSASEQKPRDFCLVYPILCTVKTGGKLSSCMSVGD